MAPELADFEQWCCEGPADLSVRLMVGAGGTGKSRLAAELCRRRALMGAVAGFVEPEASAEKLSGLADIASPLLAVIDDANARIEQTARLLAPLSASAPGSRQRVLLLARGRADWWPASIDEALDDARARLALSAADPPFGLEALEHTAAGRIRARPDQQLVATRGRRSSSRGQDPAERERHGRRPRRRARRHRIRTPRLHRVGEPVG